MGAKLQMTCAESSTKHANAGMHSTLKLLINCYILLLSPYVEKDEIIYIIEPPHDITNKLTCAPSEDSDQPGHPAMPGIRVFGVLSMGS